MPESQNTSETSNAERAKPVRGASGDGASAAPAERRSFASGDGPGPDRVIDVATTMAKTSADLARGVSRSSREASKELAASWRSASEPFMSMQMDMNRWFEDLWRQATGFGFGPLSRAARPFSALSPAAMFGLPPTDIKETEKAYILCAEAPGLAADDLDLQIKGDLLVFSGHKAETKDDAGSQYRISERRFGRFERSFPLPPDIDRENIEARFRDGVLTVTLPKAAEAASETHRIGIRS